MPAWARPNRGPPRPSGTTLPDPVTIRDFGPADADAVLALARELQAHEIRHFTRMKTPDQIGISYVEDLVIEARKHGGGVLVAEADGAICGYASLHLAVEVDDPDEVPYSYAYVADLSVSASCRGRGIGTQLMAECERRARDAGQKWLRLNVLASNESARRFYARTGLTEHLLTLEKPL